jgi:hypothetical protein
MFLLRCITACPAARKVRPDGRSELPRSLSGCRRGRASALGREEMSPFARLTPTHHDLDTTNNDILHLALTSLESSPTCRRIEPATESLARDPSVTSRPSAPSPSAARLSPAQPLQSGSPPWPETTTTTSPRRLISSLRCASPDPSGLRTSWMADLAPLSS